MICVCASLVATAAGMALGQPPRVVVLGASGRLGVLLYGMLQRRSQERLALHPIGAVGTPDGARALSKGLSRPFSLAFAPEHTVRFADVSRSASIAAACAGCDVAILDADCVVTRAPPPSPLLRLLGGGAAGPTLEFALGGKSATPTLFAADVNVDVADAQASGAAAAGCRVIALTASAPGSARCDALIRSLGQLPCTPGVDPPMLVTTAGVPALETAGWTYRTTGTPLSELSDRVSDEAPAGDARRGPLALEDLATWLAGAALAPAGGDVQRSPASPAAFRLVRVGRRYS